MPKITQYDAPALGLRPTETGINAVAGAARRIQGEYNEIAQAKSDIGQRIGSTIKDAGKVATDFIDHQQISHGATALAGMISDKEKVWNDTVKNADPNDPTIARKFLDQNLEPDLDKFKGGFITERGQQWAESHADAFRQHMFNKTSADMSTLAGEAAKLNVRQTVNSLSNTVRSDPSSLDFAIGTLQSSTGAMVDTSPNLSGTAAAKVKGEITQAGKEAIIKSAALGHIEKTGEVPEWATDPKYSQYINGAELKQFQQQARYYSRVNESEGRAAQAQREHATKLDFNQQVNDLRLSTMPKNAGDRPTLPPDYYDRLRKLGTHDGAALEPSLIKQLLNEAETITTRLNKPEPLARVSHQTTVGLLKQINAADDTRMTDTGPIYEAFDKGELSTSDFTFLNKEFANMRTPDGSALGKDRSEFFKRYGTVIDPTMGASPLGAQQTYMAQMGARQQEEAIRKKGLDPHLVYDPRSEYFFGKPANLAKYQKPIQDIVNDMATVSQPDTSKTPAFVAPKDWQWSASRRQYRDPDGKIYDASGKPVTQAPTVPRGQ